MICAVFTNNRQKAEEKLEKIKNIKCNLVQQYKSKNGLEYVFEDGEIWRWVKINETQRSIRAFKAYIDKDVDENMLRYMVLPSCAHCSNEDIFYF